MRLQAPTSCSCLVVLSPSPAVFKATLAAIAKSSSCLTFSLIVAYSFRFHGNFGFLVDFLLQFSCRGWPGASTAFMSGFLCGLGFRSSGGGLCTFFGGAVCQTACFSAVFVTVGSVTVVGFELDGRLYIGVLTGSDDGGSKPVRYSANPGDASFPAVRALK